jgi:hypothetical protein
MNDIPELQFNPKQLLSLYLNQEYDQLSEALLAILAHFHKVTYFKLSIQAQYFLNVFVKNFLYIFTQPDYLISDRYVIPFLQFNPLISNLVAISCFKNTDFYLEILQDQENNFAKILTLYSPRNRVKFNYNIFFEAQPSLACLWYSLFWETSNAVLVNKEGWQNLKSHLSYRHEKLTDFYNLADLYLNATYIDGYRDRELKYFLNQTIQNHPLYKNLIINNQPDPQKIGIITACWYPENPVYRSLFSWVESLKYDYELTLINLGSPHPNLDITLFKNVIYLINENGNLNLDILQNNNFMMIFYPEIGLSPESIILSNLRLAPIQITSVGYPVSTWGSKIDYYISNIATELPENSEINYSERLVLLPENSIISQPLNYQIQNISKNRSELIINCAGLSQQINYGLISILTNIIEKSNHKLLLRFFIRNPDYLIKNNGYLAFVKELEINLGKDNFEVILAKPDLEYLTLMEEGDIMVDTYHFSSYDTIIESLILRKPIVTFEGKKCYNRIPSQILKNIGLDELIVTNVQQYIHLVLKLIHQERYRVSIQQKLQEIDLGKTIFNRENQAYFKKSIDYLVISHQQLKREQSKQSILIH